MLYDCNSYLADVENGYAYYIDLSKNYSLVRLNTSNKTLNYYMEKKETKSLIIMFMATKYFFRWKAQME